MGINERAGQSVYCNPATFDSRQEGPLYQAARELAEHYTDRGWIVDLGCSDGVASTKLLKSGKQVVGMDLSKSAVRMAAGHLEDVAVADIAAIPLKDDAPVDVVMLLEVLEHFPVDQSVGILQQIRRLASEPHVIVSMPIVSQWPCLVLKNDSE
jgi:2-polyprenyl-3-methyl-5-hydroxy-6-metoxy-1,4-benzoquinol methylase